jgi:hypothetical protein
MVTDLPNFREALTFACLVLDWEVENSVKTAPEWAEEVKQHKKALAQLKQTLTPDGQTDKASLHGQTTLTAL